MKNQRIVRAYDSVNPTPADKQRMLDAILAEAGLEEAPPRQKTKREPVVYTAKPTEVSRKSTFGAFAAAIAIVLVAGFVFTRMLSRQDVQPSFTEPTSAAESAVTEKTATDHYAPILEKYRRSIAEGWTKEQCEIEGISLRMQAGNDLTKAGYALLDLDGDGREELIIAEESTDRTDNIWDLYTTLEDGTPIQLWVDEQDGGQCRLYDDNVISISYSNKHELDLTFYDLEAGKLVVRESLQWEDEDTVYHTDANGNTRQVTSREGQNISNAYDNQKLNLTWLAAISDNLRDSDAVEQYMPILEKYKTALLENWSWEQCDAADISRMILFDSTNKNNLGWCLLDLDKNGAEELIISDGETLIDMYCFVPKNAQSENMIRQETNMDYFLSCADGICHVIKSEDSKSYSLYENGIVRLQHVKSDGTGWCYYLFHSKGLKLQDILRYTPHHPAVSVISGYQFGSSTDNMTSISKEEAGEILFRYPELKLELTPFLEKQFPEVREPNYYYESLIETYRRAIRENWDPGKSIENGISLMIGFYGDFVENLGYSIMDLDNNGTEELIISDGQHIFDLYTLSAGEPVKLFSASERVTYTLKHDNMIYNRGSGGASTTLHVFYKLENDKLIVHEAYIYDAFDNPEAPWFFSDGEDYGDSCGDFDVQAVIDSYETVEIPFISFE